MAKGSSNFRVFNETGQSMLSDAAYAQNAQRNGGVELGVADPELHNKLYRQATIMAAALAAFITEQGTNAYDTDLATLTQALTSVLQARLIQGENIIIKGNVISTTAKAGEKGDTGATGATGPAGADGAVGPPGPAGADGAQGPQGIIGPTGPVGPIGPKGDTGNGFKVIDYYTTLPALMASVPNPSIGDAYGVGLAAPFDIYVYGETSGWVNNGRLEGAQGEKGDPGATGATGPAGADGEPGPKGDTGAQGTKGEKGDPGSDGAPGPAGTDGAQGPQGIPGAQGPQGVQGPAGANGAPGPQGERGADGAQGAQGIQGPPGVDGARGVDGQSAYAAAQEGGYAGGQAKFYSDLAALDALAEAMAAF